jgi:hypothetical protein
MLQPVINRVDDSSNALTSLLLHVSLEVCLSHKVLNWHSSSILRKDDASVLLLDCHIRQVLLVTTRAFEQPILVSGFHSALVVVLGALCPHLHVLAGDVVLLLYIWILISRSSVGIRPSLLILDEVS